MSQPDSKWQSGSFEREKLGGLWRRFAPAHAIDVIHAVNLPELKASGKRLILLDVDNTLVEWKEETFSPEVLAWIAEAKALGFTLCILSNTHRPERLKRIKDRLQIETMRGKFKPSTAMYRLALIKYGCKPEEAIMIGDQLMTDVLGANRSGIEAIWVRPIGNREFVGTKINRAVERFLTSFLYKALVIPEPRDMSTDPAPQRTVKQQIMRFVVVGGISFVIDLALTTFFMRGIHVGGVTLADWLGGHLRSGYPSIFGMYSSDEKAASPILGFAASLVAMYNSYLFNRAWTFEAKGRGPKSKQIARFYVVSIIGNFLNAAIFSTVFNLFPPASKVGIALSKVVAAGIVAVYNFIGQRFFAFKADKA